MTIANLSDPGVLNGATVNSTSGEKLGKVDAIYYDNDTNQPEWVAVKSGLFGGHVSLVPLGQGNWDGDTLTVPYDKEALKTAPHHDPDAALSPSDEDDLYRHYGTGTATETRTSDTHTTGVDTGVVGRDTTDRDRSDRTDYDRTDRTDRTDYDRTDRTDRATVGHDTSGPTTDDAMTRSEEQLRVGTQEREAGRARLRKHIVTENVNTTVPVSREEVRVEREPITDANRGEALRGGDLTEEEHEVTLSEERAVVDKDVVPVERVRLDTDTVTEQQRVDETVRKEVIETDGIEGDRTADRDRDRDLNR